MFAENLDVFLREFGKPCVAVATGYAFIGLLDTPDQRMTLAGVNVLSTEYQLLAKTSDVQTASIAAAAAVTVDGQAFTVRDVVLQDDGVFTSLTLSK